MSVPTRRRGRGGQGGHEPRARIRTREIRAHELSVLGWSQHRIAADLGISQAAVSKLLKRLETRALREFAETIERHKARQTQRLEYQYAESTRAWEASKADATRKRQRKTQVGGRGSEATVAEVVVENQHGDPRYFEVGRKALADIRKIWGLDAAKEIELRTPNPYAGMTEAALFEEVARRSRLIESPVSTAPATGPGQEADPDAGSTAPDDAPVQSEADDDEPA